LKPDPSFSKLPDLIIIDGGKGQLTSTYKILRPMGLHNTIPITGLAKREEILYKLTDQMKDEHNQVNDSPLFTEVKLPKNSESLYLIQKLRDEAHRFAITYHRNLRSKQMLKKNY
jgi:excinuclease ABC subunit C